MGRTTKLTCLARQTEGMKLLTVTEPPASAAFVGRTIFELATSRPRTVRFAASQTDIDSGCVGRPPSDLIRPTTPP